MPLPGARSIGEPIVSRGRIEDTGDDRSQAIRASLAAAAGRAASPASPAPPTPAYPGFGFIDWSAQDSQRRARAQDGALLGVEVHLRKLDTAGCLHRRVVAGIQVRRSARATLTCGV